MTKINQILTYPFILIIKFYQSYISPLIGPNCRYTPTCSQYSIISLKKHGFVDAIFERKELNEKIGVFLDILLKKNEIETSDAQPQQDREFIKKTAASS